MHRTALARTQWTRRTSAGRLGTWTLKNWLPWHRTTGRGTHSPGGSAGLCNRSGGPRRWSFVHWTRSSLRNNHARRWRLRRARNHGRSRMRRGRGRLRCGRCCNRRRSRCHSRRRRRSRTWLCRNRWGSLNWSRSRRCSGPLRHGSDDFGPRSWWWRCRTRRRSGRWRWSCHRCCNRGLCRDRRRDRPRWSRSFLLLRNRFQHISGPGDVGQIDLSLDFFFATQRSRGPGRRRLRFRRAADVGPYFFRLMLLKRTGMGLLLRHPDDR